MSILRRRSCAFSGSRRHNNSMAEFCLKRWASPIAAATRTRPVASSTTKRQKQKQSKPRVNLPWARGGRASTSRGLDRQYISMKGMAFLFQGNENSASAHIYKHVGEPQLRKAACPGGSCGFLLFYGGAASLDR